MSPQLPRSPGYFGKQHRWERGHPLRGWYHLQACGFGQGLDLCETRFVYLEKGSKAQTSDTHRETGAGVWRESTRRARGHGQVTGPRITEPPEGH